MPTATVTENPVGESGRLPLQSEQPKSIGEKTKSLLGRFTSLITGRNPKPDAAIRAIADFPLEQNKHHALDRSLDTVQRPTVEETDKERIYSTQEYFDELKKISEGELTPELVDKSQDILFNLAGKDDLVYSKAGEVTRLFNTIWGKAKLSGFDDPLFEGRYVDDLHRLERRSEIAGVLKEFKDLVRTNPQVFDSDSNLIYEFLTKGKQIDINSISEFIVSYPDSKEAIEANLSQLKNIEKPSHVPGWLSVDSVAKMRIDKPMGRFYLNLKPEFILPVFLQLILELSKNPDLAYQIKAPDPDMYPGLAIQSVRLALTRVEKVVLYSDSANCEEIFKIVSKLFGSNNSPRFFNPEKSKFAYSPRNSESEMPGISFAQEPTSHEESFNTSRAEVLKGTKSYINTPDFEERLMEDFKKHNIDPTDPAFNWPQEEGQDCFADIIA